jgi:uncharacterized protein YkwD
VALGRTGLRRLRAALGAVLVLLVVANAAAGSTARQTRLAAEPPSPDFATQLLGLINDFRAQNGLSPFASSAVYDQLAMQHSDDMLARGYLDHTSPDGVTFEQRAGAALDKEGYKSWAALENLDYGPGRSDPNSTFQRWLDSPIHRANMLSTDVKAVGIGAVYADSGPGVFDGTGPLTLVTLIAGPPQPVLGTSVLGAVDVQPVLVRLPGSTTFVRLTAPQVLPVGTEVDTTKGKARITSVADEAGNIQTADFYQGRFIISYVNDAQHPRRLDDTTPTTPTNPWVTQLKLSGPLPYCPAKRSRLLSATPKPKPKKKKAIRPTERHLWGSGTGTFRTKGRYAAATVRGTIWLTRDDCTGTLVRVVQGVVDVNDLVLSKHVSVSAGQSYIAHKPRR